MTKNTLRLLVLLVLAPWGCGVAATPFSGAERYAAYVIAGKDESQHELHDRATVLWHDIQPELTTLSTREQARWWLARADLLQFEHRFDAALDAIETVLALGYEQENAYLMQARIALTRNELDVAERSCQALSQYSPMDVVATCLLEVKGRSGDLTMSYPALVRLEERNQDPTSALTRWRRQILAEQAQLLGLYSDALRWLGYPNYAEQPVVAQKQIIDVLIATDRTAEVLEMVGQCPEINAIPVDSLLVRIAHAENLVGSQSCWRDVTAERIELRVLRADALHTSDLAYFFTHVEPNAEQALHWAELNIAVAREPFDRQLLAAAEELQP
ncbi:tetratricopeptide repeat protein [Pseudidiomarina aestuarii]|uniref:tetratricopeptide repeat protein n=1 Tax=Pseudidiomarina aestuarii TaxID=624146 RepID=UPI003A97344F